MLGELIGGLGSVIGGLFGKSSADKANRQNIQLQREFAQKGIQWKVADAKAAGVHPLAALGANTVSFSPSVVGDNSLGAGISQMGQDVGRAINATRDSNSRGSSLAIQLAEEQLKGARLDNAGKAIANTALASQVVQRSQVGPGIPSDGNITNTGIPGQNNAKFTRVQIGPLTTSPVGISDAQRFEDRYGEVVAAAAGIPILAGDTVKTGMQFVPSQFYDYGKLAKAYKHSHYVHGRGPANYGPRVTTRSFRDTFQ